ncbi:predicted protein [Histoplasma mississippiense (nom. inval.)]|uniref:predicted protein n=1 Tax=Ajellomyces capsulatus (strain NAm1 / WU24) TaxID=2059318 RepID=UPI000157C370|nr:predicted protein [Histoplasma mississippiense (nom. inval.)]EDN07266.1 predicted protein [Histoplasma mississippiense (nom. inval.)]
MADAAGVPSPKVIYAIAVGAGCEMAADQEPWTSFPTFAEMRMAYPFDHRKSPHSRRTESGFPRVINHITSLRDRSLQNGPTWLLFLTKYTPAFYYPLGICTAFPLALEMIRLSKIQAGPLTNALLHRLFLGSVAYEASVKGTAVVVSIDYTVLAIAGLIFWGGIRGIPSQGPVIREVIIHAFLVIVTAGFAAVMSRYSWFDLYTIAKINQPGFPRQSCVMMA